MSANVEDKKTATDIPAIAVTTATPAELAALPVIALTLYYKRRNQLINVGFFCTDVNDVEYNIDAAASNRTVHLLTVNASNLEFTLPKEDTRGLDLATLERVEVFGEMMYRDSNTEEFKNASRRNGDPLALYLIKSVTEGA